MALEDIGNTEQASGRSIQKRGTGTVCELGSKKRPTLPDPLVHYGRHFGRVVYAMCNIHLLLTRAVTRAADSDDSDTPDENRTPEQRREHRIFRELMQMVPGLEDRIMTSSVAELKFIAEQLTKGSSSARSDDTKSLKSAVIDWITPRGTPLVPPLARNVKSDRGFNHDATGALLCPANLDWTDPDIRAKLKNAEYIVPGDQWPILIYRDYRYDPENPWVGLLRSKIMISAFKHIFTSPSSVDKDPKATRSGNARIHGMLSTTVASLAYVATQASRSQIFTTHADDTVSDSQRFYNSLMEFLEDPEEQAEVNDLLAFWNTQIFPEYCSTRRTITKDSALSKLKEKRALLKARAQAIAARG